MPEHATSSSPAKASRPLCRERAAMGAQAILDILAIGWLYSRMGVHSVAEAKNHLSELIDRALRGEGVVITRHGRPVVELRAVAARGRPVTDADLDWLAVRRPAAGEPREDAAALVSRLRDEWER